MAMADRRSLLARLVEALQHPDVDGVLGTPDVVEELLLLGALEDKVVIGSMNRGGLDGATWTMDDRFTGYDAASIADVRPRGRQDAAAHRRHATPAPPSTIEALRRGGQRARRPRAGGDGRAAALPPRGRRHAAPAQGRPVAGPRRHDRQRARHHQRLHLAEDAVLRRPRGGLRRRRPCRASCSAGCPARTRPRTWRPGAARCASRRCAAWSSAGRCSTRPTATSLAAVDAAAEVLARRAAGALT